MSDKISIIVPVYNAEKYLPQCIESIRGQTYENLEILLVDDGSPDRCGEICDGYARQDARIKVIHQLNAGESTARNVGLDQASGAYVGFVDADDWIEPDMYERMYDCIKLSNSQIVACGWKIHEVETGRSYTDRAYTPMLCSGEEALNRLLKINYFQGYMWNKLFSADLFRFSSERFRFDESIHICQDLLLMYQILNTGCTIYYFSEPLYNYRVHTGSALGSFNDKNLTVLLARSEIVVLAQQRGGRILELAQGLYSEAAANVRARAAASGEKIIEKELLAEAKKYAGVLLKSRYFEKKNKLVFLLRVICPSLGNRLVWGYKKRFILVWAEDAAKSKRGAFGNQW